MKNEYKITKKEMMSLAKDYHLQGAATIVLFSLWCLIGVIGICMILLLSIKGGDFINWYLSILFVVLAVYKLIFSRYTVWATRYRLLSKAYGVSEWIRSTEFTENEIIVSDHENVSVSKFRYENIKKIKENGNMVMILFDGNVALRIYKDAFTEGSWEKLKAKLDSKVK